jgi:hypothetical protein
MKSGLNINPPSHRAWRFSGKRRHRAGGYVLLVTVGLLVLSSTLLVAVGRVAVQHALDARIASNDLQRRWGVASCRAAILPQSDQILTRASRTTEKAIPVIRVSLPLGSQRFDIIVADEQAKANVNSMIDDVGVDAANDQLRAGLSGTGVIGAILLRPSYLVFAAGAGDNSATTTRPLGPRPWVTGLGQIFDCVPPQRMIGRIIGVDSSPADRVTCWGSGAINLMRAGRPALRLALGSELTDLEIDRMIEARNKALAAGGGEGRTHPAVATPSGPPPPPPDADLVTRLLFNAKVSPKHRAKLALTTVSTCHSLWLVVHDRQRSWHHLFVADDTSSLQPRIECFEW